MTKKNPNKEIPRQDMQGGNQKSCQRKTTTRSNRKIEIRSNKTLQNKTKNKATLRQIEVEQRQQ